MKTQETFTVVGIKPTNDFKNNEGKNISYDYCVFHCLADMDKNVGVGSQEIIHKLQGRINFDRFKSQQLPAQAELTFEVSMTSKFPKFKLINVEFI